ncbi:MAG: STAS domain-containing protein [Treponema sp.]|nr:STAS domain-containing protein [Treponema sp.]
MEIIEHVDGTVVNYTLKGRIDINASQSLDVELSKYSGSPFSRTIILDFSAVDYISSAGIRVLLSAHKNLTKNHELIIKNPSSFCQQVFTITGADIFLRIENDIYK